MCRLIAIASSIVLAAMAIACGEEEALPQIYETPTRSASLTTETATPAPDTGGTPTPSPTPAAPPGGRAPEGCFSTELVYQDPASRFAFCYPTDMELVIADSGDGPAPTAMYPMLQENRVVVNFGWQPTLHSITGEPCVISPHVKQNEVIREFSVGGKTGKACLADQFESDRSGNPTTMRHKSIDIEVPISEGFIGVHVAVSGPDWSREGVSVTVIASRILDSAVIY
jgi:hypothetical protein